MNKYLKSFLKLFTKNHQKTEKIVNLDDIEENSKQNHSDNSRARIEEMFNFHLEQLTYKDSPHSMPIDDVITKRFELFEETGLWGDRAIDFKHNQILAQYS